MQAEEITSTASSAARRWVKVESAPLRELTPFAERRSLSSVLEPAAVHAQTDLAKILPGVFSGVQDASTITVRNNK
jgi:hypothetical protein